MPLLFPRTVTMTARKRTQDPTQWAPLALQRDDGVGKFEVNTADKIIAFDLPAAMASRKVAIHGFVPRGWKTDQLFELDAGKTSGHWNYHRSQEKNILSGLAYLAVEGAGPNDPPVTAQIE